MATHDAFGLHSTYAPLQPLLRALAQAHTEEDLGPFCRQACVCFTDLTGFSGCPWLDALRTLFQFEQALSTMLTTCGGTLIKSMGDSFLMLFPAVTPAVECVVALQQRMPTMPFCVGIGYGPLLVFRHRWKRLDVFAPEVNMASRLGEDVAHGSEVLLSDAAYAQLSPALQARCRELVRPQHFDLHCWELVALDTPHEGGGAGG